jgi:Ca2+-binding RTX toxin-like protein
LAGLGSEADSLIGTDGLAHPFSATAEANFPTATLYGFVFDYADGSAYYTGTVADDGSIGYATTVATANATILVQNPATGALAGRYTLFAEGQTTDANGTVRLQSYVDGPSGSTLSLGGMIAGMGGVGSETASFSLNGVPFTFSDTQELVDPPAATLPPAIGAPTPNAPPPASPDLALVDTTTGAPIAAAASAYSGPVAGLERQYVYTGGDSVNIAVTSDNWFLKGGAGNDALQAFGGYNVLDGGAGSNFLTGGSGTDTFFVDDRAPPSDIWSTVNNFHAGDDATVFGIVPAADGANVQWFDNQGAAGYTGLTLHVPTPGMPTASLTLPGYSVSDLNNGRLSLQYGSEPDGTPFMHIIARG